MSGPIMLGCFERENALFRSEVCDGCVRRIWLPPPLQQLLDEETRAVPLLCLTCAVERYGPPILEQIRLRAQLDGEAVPPG